MVAKNLDKFGWSEAGQIIVTPCFHCKYFVSGSICKAFGPTTPIPVEIWIGTNDHTKPVVGDNGIQFASKYVKK